MYQSKDRWSRLMDLIVMCVFWDQQLKAGRQTQPAGTGFSFAFTLEAER